MLVVPGVGDGEQVGDLSLALFGVEQAHQRAELGLVQDAWAQGAGNVWDIADGGGEGEAGRVRHGRPFLAWLACRKSWRNWRRNFSWPSSWKSSRICEAVRDSGVATRDDDVRWGVVGR